MIKDLIAKAKAAQEYSLEYESFNNTLLVNHSKTLDAYYMRKDLGFFLQAVTPPKILALCEALEKAQASLIAIKELFPKDEYSWPTDENIEKVEDVALEALADLERLLGKDE